MPDKAKAPWDKKNPRAEKGASRHLSAAQKSKAKSSAKKAGEALSQPDRQHEGGEIHVTTAKRKPTTNPRGGLTAAGRAKFKREDGSKLKPGVKKPRSEMSPEEMRRKGSWASRFYGRAILPALVKNGKPTRFALTAAAWGEPVPKNEAAARRIAAKGRKLLERYAKLKGK